MAGQISCKVLMVGLVVILATTLIIANSPLANSVAQAARVVYTDWSDPIVLQPHDGAVTSLAFSNDNRWLATGGEDGETHLWQLHDSAVLDDGFVRLPSNTTDPNGHNAGEHCGGDFPAATAQIAISQMGDSSTVHIKINKARPETLYTTWLRLKGKTIGEEAIEYGGSPLTGAGSTPLAASTALASLLSAAEGLGVPEVANGFRTDAEGNGELVAELDFPILGGAYPFQRHDESLAPLAITGAPFAPFMIRIASHCTDDLGHGVNAGNREPWFDWSPK